MRMSGRLNAPVKPMHVQPPFLTFLESGISRGGFETDDVIAAVLPLMKQVLASHRAGMVAPLGSLQNIRVEEGHLSFAPDKTVAPQKNTTKVEALQSPI